MFSLSAGLARYPSPYPMFRPGFTPRPMPPLGVISQLPRPPIPGVRPSVTPVARPLGPIAAPPEKPQTTVYVGKIAPTVDNDFLLSILRLCGPVKFLKRAQDPSDGTLKGFGFCEFEAAEGILRAMRLLSKLNIDGQELVLNINQATREYLERYVEKKTEREKLKETEGQIAESAPDVQNQEPKKLGLEENSKDDDSGDKDNHEKMKTFGIVTDEDSDADRDVSEKIANMIEERAKMRPLPPPPPPTQASANGSVKSISEAPSKSKDVDSDVDIMKNDAAEEKIDDETMSENKLVSEHDKTFAGSPDKTRLHDRASRDRNKEHDLRREKEQELERYERERERERVRRERNRDRELREAEQIFRNRMKDWEIREKEKEYQRQKEREREKEHQKERRREILKDENEIDDDDTRKRRRRGSVYEEKKRRRQREKEDDLADRLKELDDIAEAKRRAMEEQLSKDDSKLLSSPMICDTVEPVEEEAEPYVGGSEHAPQHVYQSISGETGAGVYGNNNNDESGVSSAEVFESKQNINAPTRKLGFGLVGSGKRTTVPSVFHEEDDEGVDDKKMRPLVPIDYSTEELQAVQPSAPVPTPNLAAAAEFAKRISYANPKEDKRETDRDRNGRSNDRSSQRERGRTDENSRSRNETKERMHDKIFDREKDRVDKPKAENKKLLDAKQLIDMIPKTKEELFGYEINWDTYDQHELHDRMRPWISKKITEFLGEEEATLVDYIVGATKDHVDASKMLELLQAILDDEAEMFVLKMWRMLIFEIMKVEAGLSGNSRG